MNSVRPEFIRLPEDGEHCPHTGLKRGTLRNLTLPTKANRGKPPVPARILRQRGKLRGVVLIPYDELLAHLKGLPESVVRPGENCESNGSHVEAGLPAGAARPRRTAGAKGRS